MAIQNPSQKEGGSWLALASTGQNISVCAFLFLNSISYYKLRNVNALHIHIYYQNKMLSQAHEFQSFLFVDDRTVFIKELSHFS